MGILSRTQNPSVIMALKYFEVCQDQSQVPNDLKNPIFIKYCCYGNDDLRIYRRHSKYYFNFTDLGKFVAVKLKDGLLWDDVVLSLRVNLGVFTPQKIMNYNGWVKVHEIKPVHDGKNTVFMPLKVIHGVGEIPVNLQASRFKQSKRTDRWSAVIMQPAFGELAENTYWLHHEILQFKAFDKGFIDVGVYFRHKENFCKRIKRINAGFEEISKNADEVVHAGAYIIIKKGDDFWVHFGGWYDEITKVPHWQLMALEENYGIGVEGVLKRVTGSRDGELTWDIVKADIDFRKAELAEHKYKKFKYRQNLKILAKKYGYASYERGR